MGFTTGMIAHYYDSKEDIIVAALQLMLRRIEGRLTQRKGEPVDLLTVLCEALPLDAERYAECVFWLVFVGPVSTNKKLKRINAWVHREYQRLFKRCVSSSWSEWGHWSPKVQEQTLAAIVTFINGLTTSAVANRSDWPAERQIEQLSLQLSLVLQYGTEMCAVSNTTRGGSERGRKQGERTESST